MIILCSPGIFFFLEGGAYDHLTCFSPAVSVLCPAGGAAVTFHSPTPPKQCDQ